MARQHAMSEKRRPHKSLRAPPPPPPINITMQFVGTEQHPRHPRSLTLAMTHQTISFQCSTCTSYTCRGCSTESTDSLYERDAILFHMATHLTNIGH